MTSKGIIIFLHWILESRVGPAPSGTVQRNSDAFCVMLCYLLIHFLRNDGIWKKLPRTGGDINTCSPELLQCV